MARYQLDAGQSRFTVQAFSTGMLSALAHNPVIAIRDFTGELQFGPAAPERAALHVTARTASLEVTANVNPRDRADIQRAMQTEVLETARYPEIRFQSSGVMADKIAEGWYRLQFQGQVTLHGATQPQPLDVQLRVLEDGVRLSGAFELLLSAYQIKQVSAVGGMIRLKDELKFSFDIVGRKEAE